jgi:hypothetical protein
MVLRLLRNRPSIVVYRRRLENDAERANEASSGEYPQEQTVEHQSHVLPVFLYLHDDRTTWEYNRRLDSEAIESHLWFCLVTGFTHDGVGAVLKSVYFKGSSTM